MKIYGIPKPGPRKSRRPAKDPKGPLESETLQMVIQYCKAKGYETFHIPDAMQRASFSYGAVTNWGLRRAGQEVRGFPDLIIFDVPNHRYMAMELKREGVGKLSHAQRDYVKRLDGITCWGFEQAKTAIATWETYEGKLT